MILFKKKKRGKHVDVINYQIAVFFLEKQTRPDELWYTLISKIGKLIDETPTMVPVPENAPMEIPIVNYVSQNRAITINIARSRADLILNMEGNSNDEINIKNAFQDFAFSFCQSVKVKRVGVVGTFVIELEDNVKRLNAKFLKDEFKDAVELSIRVNNRGKYEGLQLNDIAEIQTIESIDKKKKGISVSRDINNIDIDKEISKDEIGGIIDYSFERFSESNIKNWI